MKPLLTLLLFTCFSLLCSTGHTQTVAPSQVKSTGKERSTMKGAYSLLRQSVSDGEKDSLIQRQQLKIYTDTYMMYASPTPGDSLAEFGIGTYTVQNGKVKEYVFYTSANGARNDTFDLTINNTENGYNQLIHFPMVGGGTFVLSEDYKTVSKKVTSPLDGAWKLTKRRHVPKNGPAIEDNHPTQYKIYQYGHFIWGFTEQDSSAQKPVSYYGYGTFKMSGKNKITEVNSSSTFTSLLVGKPMALEIAFTGKDTYQQTHVQPNGDRFIEVYQRLP